MAPMATRRGRRFGFGTGRDAESDPDQGQLAIARSEIEAEHAREDGGQGRPVGDLAARPDRVPHGVHEPDAGAARLADAGEMGRHEHLRARLEVRAVVDGLAQPRPDRPDDAEAPSLRRMGSGWPTGANSSEWVIASMPVAAVTAGGSPTVRPGSRIVVTGRSEGWPM